MDFAERGRVSDLVGAVGSHFMFWDAAGVGFSVSSARLDDRANVEYAQSFAAIDRNLARSHALPDGVLYSCIDHYDESFARRSVFHNEFLARWGLRYIAGGRLAVGGGAKAYICLNRDRKQGGFVGDDLRRVALVQPHLQRAAGLQRRLMDSQARGDGLGLALDRLPQAAFLVGSDRRAVYWNAEAERMLAARDGLAMVASVLRAWDRSEDAALARSVAEALPNAARQGGTGAALRLSTLRSQLSAILAKTGTARQGDLLLLLGRLPGAE